MQRKNTLVSVFFISSAAVVFNFLFNCPLQALDRNDAVSLALAQMEEESMMLTKAVSNPDEESVHSDPVRFPERLREQVTTKPIEFSLDNYNRLMPTTSLDAQSGKMQVFDTAFEMAYGFDAGQLPVELTLETQYLSLNGKDIGLSLPSKLTKMAYGAQATFPFLNLDKAYLRFKVKPSFYSDNWNQRGSTLRMPTQTIMIYQYSDRLILVGGLAVFPGWENAFYPVGGVIYIPNDKLSFNLVPETPSITYSLNDKVGVFFEGSFTGTEYKVNKDGYKGAILKYNELHFGGGLSLKFTENFDAYISTGYMMNRYLKYRDSLGKVNLKNNSYSEIRFEYSI